ncbi:glycosyltransferase [Facilibium subflavum]|uniref:glycosyltransferase n=1 Tax=Facilibium subflavum TaxID=2219058 RepID=UPI000E64C782|nr:glycosyltransferase [Facilibium subflavum]
MSEFSVLMSLYDKEDPNSYAECLQSLVDQTLQATEIIVVHDGPVNDELLTIEKKFEERLPLRIICLKTNQGLGNALNEGLKHCQYDLILRMDTDDICVPERFQKQVAFMLKNSDIDIASGTIEEFADNYNLPYASRKLPLEHNQIVEFSKSRSPFNHMAVAYRKESVVKAGSYQHLLYMEDYYLWIRMILSGCRCANLIDTLVYVRAGRNMLAKRGGKLYAKSELCLLKFMRQHKFIPFLKWFKLVMLRVPVRLLPVFVRKYIYNYIREERHSK